MFAVWNAVKCIIGNFSSAILPEHTGNLSAMLILNIMIKLFHGYCMSKKSYPFSYSNCNKKLDKTSWTFSKSTSKNEYIGNILTVILLRLNWSWHERLKKYSFRKKRILPIWQEEEKLQCLDVIETRTNYPSKQLTNKEYERKTNRLNAPKWRKNRYNPNWMG